MLRSIGVIILLFILLPCSAPAVAVEKMGQLPGTLDAALEMLDGALDDRGAVIADRMSRIDSIKRVMSQTIPYEARLSQLSELVGLYTHLHSDSLSKYTNEYIKLAAENGDIEKARLMWLQEIAEMSLGGDVLGTAARIDSVDVSKLNKAERKRFYNSARDACLYFTSFYSHGETNRKYFARFGQYNDSLMAMTLPDEKPYKLLLGSHYIVTGQTSLAIAALTDYIETNGTIDLALANAFSMLSMAYYERGRKDQWLYYVTLASYVYAELGVIDNDAIRHVGSGIYERGDVNRAYRYMSLSQKDIMDSNSYMRSINATKTFPLVIASYNDEMNRYIVMLSVVALALAIAIFVGFFLVRSRMRNLKQLSKLKADLVKANSMKDTFMSRILSMCSIYIDKLEDYNKLVGRKIVAGQVDDLHKLVKSGKFLEEQSKMFYEVFDSSFIHMFPSFVDDVNRLLEPGKGFDSPQPLTKLTPELRILAFMRLGLDDSAQIARFLGLSLNTVYTYRNRMKSRAVNRATFEEDVMKIGVYG